jgi:UDPglucose--hexose-1-phosphate uridylyltransferase
MPELRKDPILGRWVIISSERGKRPSDFTLPEDRRKEGGFCPFDTGNEYTTPPEILAYRDNGTAANKPGWKLRVVPNKFPALQIEGALDRVGEGMFDKMNGIGAHEVIIETPDHEATLATMSPKAVEDVLWAYRDRIMDLKRDLRFRYVLIFKNHGITAGATLEHSHSQLIALPIVPKRVREEVDGSLTYFRYKERCIFCDIVRQELDAGIRIVGENSEFVALSPFAPRFPFETWILPKKHDSSFEDSSPKQFVALATMLQETLRRLDVVLENPAYNYILHTSPFREEDNEYYHWHIELMPKLTKVAGFEWGSGFFINPTPPEEAARFLREARIERS